MANLRGQGIQGVFLLLLMMVLGPSADFARAAETGGATIDIHNSPYEYRMRVEQDPSSGFSSLQEIPLQKIREMTASGTSEVTADIRNDVYPEGRTLSLGHFEAAVVLEPLETDSYEARVSVTLQVPEGGTKTLEVRKQVQGEGSLFEEDEIHDFAQRFAALVRSEYFSFEARYGEDFAETLMSFSARYAGKVLKEIPAVISVMVETHRLTLETKPEDEGQAQAGAKKRKTVTVPLRQEKYRRDEELNIVSETENGQEIVVSERIQASSFDLIDMDAQSRKRRTASIEYYVAIARLAPDKFRSLFTLSISYLDRPKSSFTQTLYHGRSIEEPVFFPRWKADFLTPAVDKFTMAAKGEKERVARAVFVSYLEPFLYDEYYDFSPFLVKAVMSFDHPSTQKRIESILHEKARLAALPDSPAGRASSEPSEDGLIAEYLADPNSPTPGP